MRVLPDYTGSKAPELPASPFKSHLNLSPERIEWLEKRIDDRIVELMRESGLDVNGTIQDNSWMGRRKRYQDIYEHNNEWRKQFGGGNSIFKDSNLSFGLPHRYVREIAAKMSDDIIGPWPFFTAIKKRPGAAPLARAIEELIQVKVSASNTQDELRAAQRSACVRNECVVKTRHVRRDTPYVGPADVMVDPTDGMPVATETGMLVYADDDFVADPEFRPDPTNPGAQPAMVLKKDPTFRVETHQSYPIQHFDSLPQVLEQYVGTEITPVDFRSFLCPLTAPDVHQADINVQLYDATIEQLTEEFGGFSSFDRFETYRGSHPLSGEQQAKDNLGESANESLSNIVIRRPMAEVYIRCDADEDGREEEIMAVFDMFTKKLVFFEYLANQMKKRPFEVIVGVERVEGRWYGTGVIELLMDLTTYVDMQFNRLNKKDSRANSATFRNRQACTQWKNGQPIALGTDTVYDIEPGYDPRTNPPLFRINLEEQTEIASELMTEAMQQLNLLFGVISAKDASVTDMNQSRTATGIINLERVSNIILKYSELEQSRGVSAVISQVVAVTLENLNDKEFMLSADGKILLTVNRDEARTLEREITLLLTRSRSSEMMASNQQAVQITKDYHALRRQDPEVLTHCRPLYISMLKSLEVNDPESLLPEVLQDEIAAWQQQQQQSAQAAMSHQMRQLINYKDTPFSVQAQMEQQAGLKPADDAERLGLLEAAAKAKQAVKPAEEQTKAA